LTFYAPAQFSDSIFLAPANFTGSVFFDSVDFLNITFNSPTYFFESYFNDSVNFYSTTFNAPTFFSDAPFVNYSSFLYEAVFNGRAAYFSSTTFNAPADFSESTFNDSVYFSGTTFSITSDFKGPKNFKRIITSDEKACNLFTTYYRNDARYEDADNIYYDYRKFAQDNKVLTSLSKWKDILSWATCGYGTRLSHTFRFVVGIIVSFAFIYLVLSGVHPKSYATKKFWILAILEALLFSIRHFTTLGSSECPKDFLWKLLVTLEGLLGWIMLGIFMATLTNLMIRT
jgi:hypothetical protein